MTKITHSIGVSTGLVFGGMLMLTLFIGAPAAHADTNILADRDLMVGSSGQNIVVLQSLLSEMGFLTMPANVAQGYFGSLTKSALSRYQASEGVYPTVGYFGPMTKIAMHQQFASHNWLALLGW